MPPISKIDVDLTTKCCAPTSSMGFCQQNRKPQQKGKPNKGTNHSHKVVCSRDQVGKPAFGDKFSEENAIQDGIILVTSPDLCNIMSTYEANHVADALIDQSSNDLGNLSNKENDSINIEQNNPGTNFCEKEEPDCETHSSTCSSLSSLTASENELSCLKDNIADVNDFNKKRIGENSNDTATLKTKTENSISVIIKDVKDMAIKKKSGKEGDDQRANSEIDHVTVKDFSFMQLLGEGGKLTRFY